MIAAIVVAVLGAEILGKGGDASESVLDHLRFPERATADGDRRPPSCPLRV